MPKQDYAPVFSCMSTAELGLQGDCGALSCAGQYTLAFDTVHAEGCSAISIHWSAAMLKHDWKLGR